MTRVWTSLSRRPALLALPLVVLTVLIVLGGALLAKKAEADVYVAAPAPYIQYPVAGDPTGCVVRLYYYTYDNIAGETGRDGTTVVNNPVGLLAPATVTEVCTQGVHDLWCDDEVGVDDDGSSGWRYLDFTYTGAGGDWPEFQMSGVAVPGGPVQVFTDDLGNPVQITANCAGGGTGGGTATASAAPFIDPGVADEQARGISRVYFHAAAKLIVYNQPYGYQFYTYTGEVVGLIDVNSLPIPGPGGLIASISSGQWRVDLYYIGGDHVQANLYQNGMLLEEAGFDIGGVGARSTGGPGLAVPGFGGGGGAIAQAPGAGGGGVGGGAAVAEVICRQNLRQAASTDTPVMDVLNPGVTLNIFGRSNDGTWLNVETSTGLTGWVFNGRCLNTGNVQIFGAPVEVVFESQPTVNTQGVVVAQPAPANAPSGSPVVGIVCRQNLRLGPGTDYAVARVLDTGSTLNVVGRSADGAWLQVMSTGSNGWVYFGQCVLPQVGDVTSAPVTVAFGG